MNFFAVQPRLNFLVSPVGHRLVDAVDEVSGSSRRVRDEPDDGAEIVLRKPPPVDRERHGVERRQERARRLSVGLGRASEEAVTERNRAPSSGLNFSPAGR